MVTTIVMCRETRETAMGEDRRDSKRLRWISVGWWWLAWLSGARWRVLGSSKAANTTTVTSVSSRETPTKETPETAETHIERARDLGLYPNITLEKQLLNMIGKLV